MIRKLLKVEFRDALSSMLPIGVGMVALSALVALTSVLTGRLGFHSGHWDCLNALLSFATGVCVNAFAAFLRETGSAIHSLGLPASLLLALFVVLGIAIVYLHTYLSIAIGSLFTQHRKLASIIAFFALQFIAQILFMLVIYFVATHMEAFIDGLSQFAINLLSSPNGELKAFYGSLIGASAVEAAIDAVLWLVTQTILTKKLNLP